MSEKEKKNRSRNAEKGKMKEASGPSRAETRREKSMVETINDFFSNMRTRLAIGITLSIITVVMVIVLISYLKNGAVDQSIVTGRTLEQIAQDGTAIENAGGPAGAKMADYLFVNGLGIGSFVLAFYFGALALWLFGVITLRFWSFTFKCLFTAISFSIIVGLITYNSESTIHWGGNHGHYVNYRLFTMTGKLGAVMVTLFLIGMLTVMYLNQLVILYKNAKGTIAKTREAMAAAAMRNREENVELKELPDNEEPDKAVDVLQIDTKTAKRETRKDKTSGIEIAKEDKKEDLGIIAIDEKKQEPKESLPMDILQIDSKKQAKGGEEPIFTINDRPVESKGGTGQETYNTFDGGKPYDIRDELSHYRFPTPDLLIDRPVKESVDRSEQEDNKNMIVETLKTYGIPITSIEATIGPTVTRYEIVPAEGVRISQIKRLEDDIARSLAALGIRIIAPIPGKGTIGIEVPNRDRQMVSMRSVVNSKKYRECRMALPMALGLTITNDIFIADLVKMPHLLVAGGSGQGKSVGMHAIITSLIYKKHPGELKFVLIDPKQLEFSLYSKIENHFLAKLPDEEAAIVTDPSKAVPTLSSICVEMDNRYTLLNAAGVRTIEEYNRKFTERRLNPEKGHKFMPYIVVIVDEFADLIATAGKDILNHISRIVAKARAAGIHMIIATQRPSTDVITGVIKSNFLGRIAFRVMQMVDSRTILDQPGANRLIGNGDMLFSHNGTMERVQCAFIDTSEVEAIVDHIDRQIGYPTPYILPEPEREGGAMAPGAIDLSKRDEMFDECARFVVQNSTASTSSLQRRFSIGYNKAGKIMDQMEAAGIVGPADGQRPRAVLVDSIQLESLLRGL